ncbi:hypothetical protein DAPPUDRAFT_116142 [Daphnia pulex]|uniref:Uncharacterized protein n=1 Tax=Daphnia pulex TaxID=6669 RepID=E9HNP9_DAPPU|nr:hypothetical protein DAPPUDRAFT_116142 [Daphnia pulex]|eukprot:EFX66650.1 hypothetical protein DAPPUDRAFT_116142 [Daphnia pulex]
MDRPTNESSRRHLKGYVTKWINEINNNKNVTMDFRSSSYLWMAEIRLLSLYSRFKQYSYGVLRDLAVFHATQQEFDHEQDLQRAMQSEVEEALAIVKTKREDYKAQQGKEGVEEDSSDTPFFVDEPIRLHPPRYSKFNQSPALSLLERPATSLDASQLFPNNSQLIKSSCTFKVLEDPVSSEKHQPHDSNPEKMAPFSPSEGPATSLDLSVKLLPPETELELAASLSLSEGPATSLDSSANLLPPSSKLESAASLSLSEGPATSLDSSVNLMSPNSKPESAAAPSFSEKPATSLDKGQLSPKDPQLAVLSLLRCSASVLGKQHDSTRKKNKSTTSVKPIILETQTKQENPDDGELPSEEAPEADDDKQTDLTASLEEFRTQNSPTRKRLERVTPLRLDKESAKAENLIDQLLRVKLSIKVSNTNISQQLINVFVLVTEVRFKILQFVWDPGGTATNRVSRLSLGPASETSLTPTTKRNDQQEDEVTGSKRIWSQRHSCSSVCTLPKPAVLASLPTNQKMIQPTIQPSISNPMEWALVGSMLEMKWTSNRWLQHPAELPPIHSTQLYIFKGPDRWPRCHPSDCTDSLGPFPPWCQCNVLEGVGPSLSTIIYLTSQSKIQSAFTISTLVSSSSSIYI